MWYVKAANDLRAKLLALKPEFVAAAQKVYDDWVVDPNDEFDDEYAGGGVCHLIADAIAEIVSRKYVNLDVHVVDSQGVGDQHVWVCVCDRNSCFDVDIPPSLYEKGGGYSWTKIPNIQFSTDDIIIYPQKYRPE